ncbi:MAG TPA: peroxidase family protein [Chthoniobacterales bacterium]|nr:peroxidase family protein [Chthoniobacterales bacterium]
MDDYLRPFRESALDRYCRLFRPMRLRADADQYCQALTELGRAMIDDGTRVSDERPEILVDSGYTYFGQFIAHDLTKDVSSVDGAWQKEPEELENLQTPKLDLSTLYGGGPEISPELYETDGVRLKVGQRKNGRHSFDIHVAGNGGCVLADERNTENLILRQMTAVFARVHNFAVEQFQGEFADNTALFARARLQTQWQYQWLVCRDYLPTLLDPAVYREVFVHGRSIIRWNTFSVPIEFAAAAMRFGHAMVRPNYLFSFGQEMRLPQIFSRTSERGPLDEKVEINWGFFFQGAGDGRSVTSRPIDTRLAPSFQLLPDDLVGVAQIACPHFRVAKNPAELPVRTLLRGAGLRLASGQSAARALHERVLSEAELTQNLEGEETAQGQILRDTGLTRDTPLWYYILKESEVRHNGNRVGPLGSRVIAETLYAALRADPNSYLNRVGADDFPPVWRFAEEDVRLYGLSEFFRTADRL